MAKRITYFILTNILVLTTISIVLQFVGGYIVDGQIAYGPLLIVSAVIGFTGSFISLFLSRWMAKRMMGVRVLDPNGVLSEEEEAVVEKVHRLARAAGMMYMPEVGIYESDEVNAFATGPSKKTLACSSFSWFIS